MSTFLKIYVQLENRARKDFAAFVKVRSGSDGVHAIIDFLLEKNPEIKTDGFDSLLAEVFPNGQINSNKKRHLHRLLIQHAEEYSILKHLEKSENSFQRKTLFAESLKNKGDDSFFFDAINQAINKLEGGKRRDIVYYRTRYALNHSRYFHWRTPKGEAPDKVKNDWLGMMQQDLESLYQITSCQLDTERQFMQSRVADYKPEKQEYPLPELCKIFKKNIELTILFDDDAYKDLKRATFESLELADNFEQSNLIYFLLNHCANAIRKNKIEYYKEYVAVVDAALNKKLLMDYGTMDSVLFLNCVTCSLRTGGGGPEVAHEFIENWRGKLHSESKKYLPDYASTKISMSEGEFQEALDSFNQIQDTDGLQFDLHIRTDKLVCQFELEKLGMLNLHKSQDFPSIIGNNLRYLNRKESDFQNGNDQVLANKNFCLILRKIANKANELNITQEDKQNLQEELEGFSHIVLADWLKKQIDWLPS